VNRTDCGWRGPHPFFARFFTGLHRPKERILGSDFAGEVDAVGAAVTEFAVGDHVVGSTGGFRANAEFVCVRESATVAHKPAGMTLEEAASICEGAFYALKCLRAADVGEGRRIVVYGASGAIGTAGVQLAKHLGAHVTAVCDTQNLELMRSLGADEVLDYTREDFTESGETYDVVFDAAGKHSFRRCRRSLKPGGTYVTTDLGFLWHVPALILLTRWIGDKRVLLPIANPTKNDLLFLQNLIEAGSTGPSSIGPIRSRTWSRRRGTSKRARRPETSS
jgi:NADPH:quinone reductase-like Zn-dependent oxidoreductase